MKTQGFRKTRPIFHIERSLYYFWLSVKYPPLYLILYYFIELNIFR